MVNGKRNLKVACVLSKREKSELGKAAEMCGESLSAFLRRAGIFEARRLLKLNSQKLDELLEPRPQKPDNR
jgi:hypothetical protein